MEKPGLLSDSIWFCGVWEAKLSAACLLAMVLENYWVPSCKIGVNSAFHIPQPF